jgi:hypothetical protein
MSSSSTNPVETVKKTKKEASNADDDDEIATATGPTDDNENEDETEFTYLHQSEFQDAENFCESHAYKNLWKSVKLYRNWNPEAIRGEIILPEKANESRNMTKADLPASEASLATCVLSRSVVVPYLQPVAHKGNEFFDQRVEGLYWCGTVQPKGKLPVESPYGPVRALATAAGCSKMLSQSKLYFGNSYLVGVNRYVILVAVPNDASKETKKAIRKLKLRPFNKDGFAFLKFEGGEFKSRCVWLEVFYCGKVSGPDDFTIINFDLTTTGRNKVTKK